MISWPKDTPPWLRTAVEDLESDAETMMLSEDPAKACGFAKAVYNLKLSISSHAESAEEKRRKQLHELTFGVPSAEPVS